jgi:RNA polymerase sigma factor (sigma-70 family)
MSGPSEISRDRHTDSESPGSLSILFSRLEGCDPAVLAEIWRRFFPRMTGLARKTMARFPRGEVDDVDVAQSAFISFWRAWKNGAGFEFDDREDLWKLLSLLTARKAMKSARRRLAKKRGGGNTVVESDLAAASTLSGRAASLDAIVGRISPPEFDLVCEEMLLKLTDDERATVVLRMQNHTIEEIAERMTCSARTVQRTLEGVRRRWEVE